MNLLLYGMVYSHIEIDFTSLIISRAMITIMVCVISYTLTIIIKKIPLLKKTL